MPVRCSSQAFGHETPEKLKGHLVYSGPTVLLLMDGKEVYRGSKFIDLEELEYNINRFQKLSEQ